MSAEIIAVGAISALGRGAAAFDPGRVGEPAMTAVRHDSGLEAAGLKKPFAAAVRESLPPMDDADRAGVLLAVAAEQLVAELDRALPSWRGLRCALSVGTSGGGMPSLVECATRIEAGSDLPVDLARRAPYFGPLAAAERALGATFEPTVQVLAACASSTYALGLALRWIELGYADLVVAGGYDALSPFIAAGFECLGATAPEPLPFRRERQGLALGEGAALVALAKRGETGRGRGLLLGFAGASDAVHITAPDRDGRGLVRAATRALRDAAVSLDSVGLVSAHGTGTSYNDAAEAKALREVFGEQTPKVVVHPFKAVVGHTLGAAGAIESLSALTALDRGVAPAAAGRGAIEPELDARLLDCAEASTSELCLKLSSAFGGANAALVLGREAAGAAVSSTRVARSVGVVGIGAPVTETSWRALHGRVRTDEPKLARMDPLSLIAVAAVAELASKSPIDPRTGVVVGTAAATLEIDFDFERRRRTRGPEPRRFPATSPNLVAGECSIAFGLVGPTLSVGASTAAALEALLVAFDLVAAGDVEQMLVVAAEHVAESVPRLWRSAGWPVPVSGAVALLLGAEPSSPPLARADLLEALGSARRGHGVLGGRGPGWPALLGTLSR